MHIIDTHTHKHTQHFPKKVIFTNKNTKACIYGKKRSEITELCWIFRFNLLSKAISVRIQYSIGRDQGRSRATLGPTPLQNVSIQTLFALFARNMQLSPLNWHFCVCPWGGEGVRQKQPIMRVHNEICKCMCLCELHMFSFFFTERIVVLSAWIIMNVSVCACVCLAQGGWKIPMFVVIRIASFTLLSLFASSLFPS